MYQISSGTSDRNYSCFRVKGDDGDDELVAFVEDRSSVDDDA